MVHRVKDTSGEGLMPVFCLLRIRQRLVALIQQKWRPNNVKVVCHYGVNLAPIFRVDAGTEPSNTSRLHRTMEREEVSSYKYVFFHQIDQFAAQLVLRAICFASHASISSALMA